MLYSASANVFDMQTFYFDNATFEDINCKLRMKKEDFILLSKKLLILICEFSVEFQN